MRNLRPLENQNAPSYNALLRVGRFRLWQWGVVSLLLWSCCPLPLMLAQEQPTPQPTTHQAHKKRRKRVGDDAPTPESTATPSASDTPSSDATPNSDATPQATATNTATPAATNTPTPVTPGPLITPAPLSAISSEVPRAFGRTVIVVLGGISWGEWAGLSTGTSTLTPGFKQILEEGALAAARLPGEVPQAATVEGRSGAQSSTTAQEAISPALLRAAAVLSAGTTRNLPSPLPPIAALTLGADEHLNVQSPSYEDASATVAYARRTDLPIPPQALLNLGWGAFNTALNVGPDEIAHPICGALGDAVHQAGGRTAALGSADTSYLRGRGLLLREWALAGQNGQGVVDGGDVSRQLLARDATAPFGLRTNARALLAAFDAALQDEKTALITVEWGDTRRAALYAPWCSPQTAARHRRDALLRADAWLRVVLTRLTDARRDRLIVLDVPDLHTSQPQWLPLVLWRPQRGGQGALLEMKRDGQGPGIVSLESIFSTLLERLNVPPTSGSAGALVETGKPAAASKRLSRLLALQAGVAWLDAARVPSQGLWAACFALTLLLSLGLLMQQAGVVPLKSPTPTATAGDATKRGQQWAHSGWFLAMLLPLLAWLVGPSLEATWRFGNVASNMEASNSQASAGADWKLMLSLLGVALLILGVLAVARKMFGRVRLRAVGIGLTWLILTLLGLLLGGFALPWNALLGSSLLSDPATRIGDVWALLLISATLLGVAGLTQPSFHDVFPTGDKASPPRKSEAIEASRRVINLRPAALWMIVVTLLLLAGGWGGRNPATAVVAGLGFSVMWLRLWLERAERAHRLRVRRVATMIIAALAILLLWQRGGWTLVETSLSQWWPQWLATWHLIWWDIAFAVTALATIMLLIWLRPTLRLYLQSRYSFRAMLLGTSIAALTSLLIFGSYGPPLIALYTLGAITYEVMNITPMAVKNVTT